MSTRREPSRLREVLELLFRARGEGGEPSDNAITAEISIVSGVLGTGALTVTLEFSNDLDCWTNLSNYYVVTLGEAPAREFLPQYNGAEARFRFARLRYQAVGSAHVLLTASIFTYSQT